MAKYKCNVCGYVYDEDKEGKKWDELASDWVCPDCGVGKDNFERIGEAIKTPDKKEKIETSKESSFTIEIKEIIQETHDVKTFVMERPAELKFVAGQYCLVSIYENEKYSSIKKPFTFSSSPDSSEITLTIKQVGEFTKEMFSLNVGDKLIIDGPKGESLNFDSSVKEDIVLLAGGAGITPFLSIMRYAVAKKLSNKIYLFFGNRTVEDIICRKELDMMQSEKIKVFHLISGEDVNGANIEKGYINKEKIMQNVLDYKNNKIWFICGPPAMNKAMKEMLANMGISEEKIRIDKWEIPGKSS